MESAVPQPTRSHRLSMPWGLIAGLEVLVFAVVSGGLILDVFPSAFDLEWGCVGSGGELRTAADTYVSVFAVIGALGWVIAAAIAAVVHAAGRRWLALVFPAAWFAVIVLLALVVAASIGPVACG